jgi:hypothetical protein
MSHVVGTRRYADGARVLIARVLDNGCVELGAAEFTLDPIDFASVASAVLRELADLADAAKGSE